MATTINSRVLREVIPSVTEIEFGADIVGLVDPLLEAADSPLNLTLHQQLVGEFMSAKISEAAFLEALSYLLDQVVRKQKLTETLTLGVVLQLRYVMISLEMSTEKANGFLARLAENLKLQGRVSEADVVYWALDYKLF